MNSIISVILRILLLTNPLTLPMFPCLDASLLRHTSLVDFIKLLNHLIEEIDKNVLDVTPY